MIYHSIYTHDVYIPMQCFLGCKSGVRWIKRMEFPLRCNIERWVSLTEAIMCWLQPHVLHSFHLDFASLSLKVIPKVSARQFCAWFLQVVFGSKGLYRVWRRWEEQMLNSAMSRSKCSKNGTKFTDSTNKFTDSTHAGDLNSKTIRIGICLANWNGERSWPKPSN